MSGIPDAIVIAEQREGLKELAAENERLRGVLTLIAAPMRPDGTWNRCREACRQLAVEALQPATEPAKSTVQPSARHCPHGYSYAELADGTVTCDPCTPDPAPVATKG